MIFVLHKSQRSFSVYQSKRSYVLRNSVSGTAVDPLLNLKNNAAKAAEIISMSWGYKKIGKWFTKLHPKNFTLEDDERWHTSPCTWKSYPGSNFHHAMGSFSDGDMFSRSVSFGSPLLQIDAVIFRTHVIFLLRWI